VDHELQKRAVQTARRAIESSVMARPLERITAPSPGADEFGGTFVTIHNSGRLRGCMGTFSPQHDLLHTIQEVAQNAARDPRFVNDPIAAGELDEIGLDVSVLSRAVPTPHPLSLQVGVHGIFVRRGNRNGCFLPQVAAEQHWDAAEFLSRCCELKAGLDRDAWKAPDTEVFLFTSEVWKEGAFGEPQSAPDAG